MCFIITYCEFFLKFESREAFSGLLAVSQSHWQKVPLRRCSRRGSYSRFVRTALDKNWFIIFLSQCFPPNRYLLCRRLNQVNDKWMGDTKFFHFWCNIMMKQQFYFFQCALWYFQFWCCNLATAETHSAVQALRPMRWLHIHIVNKMWIPCH